ncbi:phospholipase D-like domain-containing protein [Methylocystis parvus]|uniref:phospholipase D-like domain-containing protein n=1 Tax=Methylocystis parvus TaxID=134 RepID=UPI003C709566
MRFAFSTHTLDAAMRFAETSAARRALGGLMVAFAYVAGVSLSAELGAPAEISPAHAEPLTLPDFEQHFAPTENLERLDVAEIARATRTLDVAAYALTDVAVIDAIAEAARRGVKVRVYLDGKQAARNDDSPTITEHLGRLAETGALIKYKPGAEPPMHLTAYCVDGATLRTGAANFSASGLKMQDNDAVFLRGANVCAAFAAHFATMWGR